MSNRENNMREISHILRDIQQLSEYTSNNNTFNVNINYYEKYYNNIKDITKSEELSNDDISNNTNDRIASTPDIVESPVDDQVSGSNTSDSNINDTEDIGISHIDNTISNDTPTNSFYIEVTGESELLVGRNQAPDEVNNTSDNRTDEPVQNNETSNNTSSWRQLIIPFTASLNDINNSYPVNLSNNLANITNIINRSLTDELNNINIPDSGERGLSLNQVNLKTCLGLYNSLSIDNLELKCHICNEEYSTNDICRKNIICGHYLHQSCLDNWYSSHNTCPICSRVI